MSIIIQVEKELKRLEMVGIIHQALADVDVDCFSVVSTTDHPALSNEMEDHPNPDVAGYSFLDYSDPILYVRDLQGVWEDMSIGQYSEKIANLQEQLQSKDMRGDSSITFLNTRVQPHSFGDHEYGTPQSQVLESTASGLLKYSDTIERVAIVTTDFGHYNVREIRE